MDERLLRAPAADRENIRPCVQTARVASDDRPTRRDLASTNERLMRHDPPHTTIDGLVNRPDW